MPKTYYAANSTLSMWLLNTSTTPPVAVWCALFLTAPSGPGATPTEVSGSGYGRQTVTFTTPNNGQCSNTSAVSFPVDQGTDWGTVVAYGLYDASSGGNLLYYANLSSPRTVQVNDQVVFPVGTLIAIES